jgi:glycosyltransferase involved in cell wall biosynthesis
VLQEPLITTIIPTYRRPKLLRRAIQSVLNQTYPHFLVCVYDNASGDETEAVVAEFAQRDPRVRYHCNSENIGLVGNFRCGTESVTTPFFNVLSDDDLAFPQFFENALTTLARYDEAILFAGATIWISPEGVRDVPIARWRDGVYQPPEGLFTIIRNGHPDFTGTMFRLEVLEKVGTLDPTVGNPFDVDFFCRCAALYPIAVSTTPCGVLFQHRESAGWIAADSGQYRADVVAGHWIKIADNIAALNQISAADRETAAKILMKRARGLIFRCACRAAIAGRSADAGQALSLLQNSFAVGGVGILPFAVNGLEFISKGLLGGAALNCVIEATRNLKAKLHRMRMTRDKRLAYESAVGRLMSSVQNSPQRG